MSSISRHRMSATMLLTLTECGRADIVVVYLTSALPIGSLHSCRHSAAYVAYRQTQNAQQHGPEWEVSNIRLQLPAFTLRLPAVVKRVPADSGRRYQYQSATIIPFDYPFPPPPSSAAACTWIRIRVFLRRPHARECVCVLMMMIRLAASFGELYPSDVNVEALNLSALRKQPFKDRPPRVLWYKTDALSAYVCVWR